MEVEEERRMKRYKRCLVAHRSGEHHVANEQDFHPLDWSTNWNYIQFHPFEYWSWIPSNSCDQACVQPKEFTIKGLSALLRGAFTPSSFPYRLSLNFLLLLLFFSLTLIIFNLLEKCFHIFMFTKIMLSNLFLIQRGKLLWVSYKRFHQEAWVW